MRLSNNSLTFIFLVISLLALLVAAFAWTHTLQQADENCAERGGMLLQGAHGFVCVSLKELA